MKNKSQKFLLVGNGAYSNKGCEAIVRGTVYVLTRRFPEAKFILSSFGKTAVNDAKSEVDPMIEHRVPREGIRRFSPLWWKYRIFLRPFSNLKNKYVYSVQRDALRESNCALEIGGDNYSLDYYGLPINHIDMDKTLMTTGKPLILWGGSIGPFTVNKEAEHLMKEHLKPFNLICAREGETIAYLASIGIEENVKLVADPAFVMPVKTPNFSDELFRFIERKPIGLNLSPLIGRFRSGDQKGNWVGQATKCIENLVNSSIGPILLVPHAFNEGNNDYEFMMQAAYRLSGWGDRMAIVPPNLRAEEYKWVISKLRAFAGARTHSTIAALSSGVPTVSIAYSMKARGINKDIFGHTDWHVSSMDLTPKVITEKMKKLLSRQEDIRKQLEVAMPAIKNRALSAGDYLAEVLIP